MMARIISMVVTTQCLFMLIMMTHCKSGNTKKQLSDSSIRAQIQAQLGQDVRTEFNASKSYALIQQIPDPKKIGAKSIHFVVLRLRDSVVVYEDSYLHGYVKWIDDNALEKLSFPGKLKPDQDMDVYKKVIRVDQSMPKL
jgi:hypothetical protein